ncbi:vesicular glutamate transporter 3-like isoform X1 [Planococcus citri]|uniref:vesicular glutamate transporter 3-like isoform X1 n=1 Tax=Planococcus citri TaxID=170843 RepID=UPI0031F87E66
MKSNGVIEPDVPEKFPYNNNNDIPKKVPKDPSKAIWCSKRLLVAIAVFMCFANCTMLINVTNIAVVEMTSNKTITMGDETFIRPAEFEWDTVTLGTVSNVLWYGGLFALFGGYFVDKFGGSVSCSMSLLIAGFLTIFHPAILYLDFNAFLVCRFVTGFFLNVFSISTAELYSRWFPRKERSTLISIGYNGVNAGIALAFPLFGFIANKWGWQMVFYVSGVISLIISILCLTVVKNRPSQDTWISKTELAYILEETGHEFREERSHPYKRILLSTPVLAMCVGKFTLMWINTILSASLPLYIKDLTNKSTDEVGIISSLPTVAQIFAFPLAGIFLDGWRNRKGIDLTRMHKITICIAFLSSSILFVVAVFINDFTISMILFVVIQIIMSTGPAVLEPIIVNISPNDTSVIAALGKFSFSMGSIVSRTCIGFMTINHSSQEWNNCFLLTSAVLILSTVIFLRFASSETQPWSSSTNFDQERTRLIKINYRRRTSS